MPDGPKRCWSQADQAEKAPPSGLAALMAQREALLMQLTAVDTQIAALQPQQLLCNGQ